MTEAFEPREYWEERLGADYALEGVGFRRLGPGFNRWSYRVRDAAFRRAVRPLAREHAPRRVLDIGSGTGFYLDRWRGLDAEEIVGSDITETAVGKLRAANPNVRILRVDAGDAELPAELEPDSFDYVSAMDVLFHIMDDERYARAFRNLAGLLRPGGYLVFSEDFVHGERAGGTHKVVRPIEQIESCVAAAGLEVIRRRPIFFLMNRPLDSDSAMLERWWRLLRSRLGKRPRLGGPLGAALYPAERALGAVRREGPSTELMVCRRPQP
jgi:SAM-dependent methyltransferase